MRETKKSSQEIIQNILSGDSYKIWEASCEIGSLSQNHTKIMELVPYKKRILDCTQNIDLGGGIYKNSMHLKRALAIIEFHEQNLSCPCCLLGEFDNPRHLVEEKYFSFINKGECNYTGECDYTVRCNRCNTIYKVEPQEYHSVWWEWTALEQK